jgi:hypothetical protein
MWTQLDTGFQHAKSLLLGTFLDLSRKKVRNRRADLKREKKGRR